MASASASTSCSSTCSIFGCDDHQWRYDVFLSFRGEDTRDNFISHLYASLSDKGIDTFIDYQLRKGDKIAPALVQAIQDSNVSLVIFSENYATSSWCLNELVEIMECSETRGQIVIPVFYNVDPLDIRKQTGSFGKAFADKYEGDSKNAGKVREWKAALNKAANHAGWASQDIRPECTLVDKIVQDVVGKLKLYMPYDLQGLVGIDLRIRKIKRELCIGLLDVRILGIWGMGGIGKTTIAEAIFGQIRSQFECCCFLENVREEFEKRGIKNLLKELLARTLGEEDIKVDIARPGPALIRRLHRKKLLVVLDDVDNSLDLERLIGDPCWFGPGSRVIITSRDKHVLEKYAPCIHKVELLKDDDALELFSWNAFKQKLPIDDFLSMSNLVIKYAQGNPLALKVLGSFLCGKTKSEWESAVSKLSTTPNNNLQNVLKISYDSLDREERDVFLHVACFFKGREYRKLHLSHGLAFLPDELRYLYWQGYPLQSLPLNFKPRKLFVLNLPHSNIKQLWDETKDQSNLEMIARCLIGTPMTSQVKNLANMILVGCLNLVRFPLFVDQFRRLTCIRLIDHHELRSLPNNIDLDSLDTLDLTRCLKLETFPEVSRNIRYLYLCWTAIEKLPSSAIECLSRLVELEMEYCENLESLPSNIWKLQSLCKFSLGGCSKLKKFPEILETMDKLKELHLYGTAIDGLPLSIDHLKELERLNLFNCRNLHCLPETLGNLKALKHFTLSIFPRQDEILPRNKYEGQHYGNFSLGPLLGASSMERIYISGWLRQLPADLGRLSFLYSLSLSGSNIETMPRSIKQLSRLNYLTIDGCQMLESLPELPPRVWFVSAQGCSSLKRINALKQLLLESRSLAHRYNLSNCCKLDQKECGSLVNAMLRNRHFSDQVHMRKKVRRLPSFRATYPGSVIPEWFEHQSVGRSVRIQLSSNWFNDRFLGFALCLVLQPDFKETRFGAVTMGYECCFGNICDDDSVDVTHALARLSLGIWVPIHHLDVEHVVLRYSAVLYDEIAENKHRLSHCDVALFKFSELVKYNWKIKKCGVTPICAQEEEDCNAFEISPKYAEGEDCDALVISPIYA